MKSLFVFTSFILGTSVCHADKMLLECYSDISNIYTIKIMQGSAETYRLEEQEFHGFVRYPVKASEISKKSFELSPDRLGNKRVLSKGQGSWSLKVSGSISEFATLQCPVERLN